MNVNFKNRQSGNISNDGTAYSILITCGIGHFLNDMIQSIIPSISPLIKDTYGFSFAQIGIITLVFQMMSSYFSHSQAITPTGDLLLTHFP